MEVKPIVPVPAPWKLKGTVYMVTFWAKGGKLPDFTYSPLEAASAFSDPAQSGEHKGGLSQFQIIRYAESPVGPYDELIVCPGFFTYHEMEDGQIKKKSAPRITRIYVSQKYTCWNGRKNWNIPKHLARFEFKDLPDGSTTVKVYPHDTDDDVAETYASEIPFFQAKIRSLQWAPSFPLSSNLLKYIGIDISLVQPPLPTGDGSQKELPGTDHWTKVVPGQKTKNACLTWVDMWQGSETITTRDGYENFWPGLGRWQLGLKMEDADIEFGEPIHWNLSQPKL
ncbi:hypothetical protein PG996_000951 [Apiospora saccharicola]|uniref:Acetoacetate decarboxylase n=1 Tax=Apiospora saccharicola TaxID=335842 RepID=A0ABR1WFC6_9PEZI